MRFTDQTLNLEELAVPEFQTAWQGVFKNRSEGQFHPNSLFDHCSCTLYAPISNFTLAEGASVNLIKSLLRPATGLNE